MANEPAIEEQTETQPQELLLVKSTYAQKSDGGNVMVLNDRNADHPTGEAFIADQRIHEVAPTAKVSAALHAGDLVKATTAEWKAQKAADKAALQS